MIKKVSRNEMRLERHARIRKDLMGTTERPRLCVFKSAMSDIVLLHGFCGLLLLY